MPLYKALLAPTQGSVHFVSAPCTFPAVRDRNGDRKINHIHISSTADLDTMVFHYFGKDVSSWAFGNAKFSMAYAVTPAPASSVQKC